MKYRKVFPLYTREDQEARANVQSSEGVTLSNRVGG